MASAASAQDSTRDVVTDKISVTVVEIPVQVLRKGKHVTGLTAEDFEVFDRGLERRIVDFDVLDLSDPGAATPRPSPRSTPKGPRSRHVLVMIDLDFTDWTVLPRAILGARELAQHQLHPSDHLAVGFLSPTLGAQLLHGFTTEREPASLALDVIEALVDRDPDRAAVVMAELAELVGLDVEGMDEDPDSWRALARRWLRGSSQAIGASPLLSDQPQAEAGPSGGRALPRDEARLDPVFSETASSPSLFDEQTQRRLLFMGKALRDLTLSLSHIPEPKQLLLFSAGIPSRFLDSRSHATRILARLELVIKACLEAGWTLQAIDVRGIPSIDEPIFDGNALFHLARHTGGQLFENFNRIGSATERILDRSRVTYILVIQPDVEADGSFHDLEVRLKGGGGGEKLQHRPGYRAPTPAGRMANLDDRRDVAQLILSDSEIVDFDFDLLTMPVPVVAGRSTVPVVLEIPGEVLLENPFGDTASVEVHAYGLDVQGGIQDLFVKRLDVDLRRSEKRLRRGGLRIIGQLDLGTGHSEVRVLVRNLANDAISIAKAEVELPALATSRFAVLPPLFVDQTRNWVSLKLARQEDAMKVDGFTTGIMGGSFFPQISPAFRGKQAQQLVLNLFLASVEEPLLQMRVLSARGEEVEGPRIFLGTRFQGIDGGTGLVATLEPRGLAPGGYSLEIALVDPVSGDRVASSHRFVIEESVKGSGS